MIKLLIGGSPCTYWSIAQKNNRETEASGIGWELFKNYLIAKEKFKPDYFLYENNVSAAKAIKDQIKEELRVWDAFGRREPFCAIKANTPKALQILYGRWRVCKWHMATEQQGLRYGARIGHVKPPLRQRFY